MLWREATQHYSSMEPEICLSPGSGWFPGEGAAPAKISGLKRERALRSDGGRGKDGAESAPDRGSSCSKTLFAQLGSLDNFFQECS